MSHSIFDSVLSSPIELYIAVIGAVLGIVVAVLWDEYRSASILIIGFVLAMSVGQSMSPWAGSYIWLVEHRPIAAKPWYLLVSMVIAINLSMPLFRLARAQAGNEPVRTHLR